MMPNDKQKAHYKVPIEGELIASPFTRRVATVVSVKAANKEGFYWIDAQVTESKDGKRIGEIVTFLFSYRFKMNHSNCYKAIIDLL